MAIIVLSSNWGIFKVLIKNRTSTIIYKKDLLAVPVSMQADVKKKKKKNAKPPSGWASTNVFIENKIVIEIQRTPTIYAFSLKLKDMLIASGPKTWPFYSFHSNVTTRCRYYYSSYSLLQSWQSWRSFRAAELSRLYDQASAQYSNIGLTAEI